MTSGQRMRVVVILQTFTPDMGYFGNMFPRYLARLGVDVHVITTDLPHNFQLPEFRSTYRNHLGSSPFTPGTECAYDGYTLHVLPHEFIIGNQTFTGLAEKLRELAPDVVQAPTAVGWLPLVAAREQRNGGYALFTGSHTAASTFPIARVRHPFATMPGVKIFLTRWIAGRWISLRTQKCYAPTIDCAEIAWKFFGVEREKVEVMHLGVDTDAFHPVASSGDAHEREALRRRLGFDANEVVFVYSGKFTEVKDPLILARAVAELRSRGAPVRALFIGDGPQREALRASDGSVVLDFMKHSELPGYYRASEVGVWPTNESTSMLDAAACGLPLVVSDGIVYREHVDGNGLVVRMGDPADLVSAMTGLLDAQRRATLGTAGALKMRHHFAWESVARRRLRDYEAALAPQVSHAVGVTA